MNMFSSLRLIITVSLAAALAAAAEPLSVAVFDFQGGNRSLEKTGSEIAVLLNVQLSTADGVLLVERAEVDKILGEQQFGMSGTVSADSAAKVGALLGARVLVTGRVLQSGEKTYLVAKIMGTETGRVFSEMVTVASLENLELPVTELAGKIAATIAKQAPHFVAKVESFDERVERLKRAVAGRKLPPVVIKIPEAHVSGPNIDPAGQTELMHLLAAVGFEVVSGEKSLARNDLVTISGEAFSAYGLRRGDLVSCRARIEVLVKDASGQVIAADRQMDVAVDIAELPAGKKALESAALKLADRLVPKLAR